MCVCFVKRLGTGALGGAEQGESSLKHFETYLLCLLWARSCAGRHGSTRRQRPMRLRVFVSAGCGAALLPQAGTCPTRSLPGEGEGQGQEGLQGADQGVHTAWQQGASGRKSAALREGHRKPRATKLYTEPVTWHFAPTSHLASTQRRGLGGAVAAQGEVARTGGRGSRWPSPSLPLLELQVHGQRLPSCKVTPQAFKKCPLHQQTPLRSWLIFRETGDPWS